MLLGTYIHEGKEYEVVDLVEGDFTQIITGYRNLEHNHIEIIKVIEYTASYLNPDVSRLNLYKDNLELILNRTKDGVTNE